MRIKILSKNSLFLPMYCWIEAVLLMVCSPCVQLQAESSNCPDDKIARTVLARTINHARTIQDALLRRDIFVEICRVQIAIGALEGASATVAAHIDDTGSKDGLRLAIARAYALSDNFEEALRICRNINDEGNYSIALQSIAVEQARSGDYGQAVKMAKTIRLPLVKAVTIAVIAKVAASNAQQVDSSEIFRSALQIAMSCGQTHYIQSTLSRIAVEQAECGDVTGSLLTAKSIVEIPAGKKRLQHRESREIYADTLSKIALVSARLGEMKKAHEIIQSISDIHRNVKQTALANIAILEAEKKNFNRALTIIRGLDPKLAFNVGILGLSFPKFDAQIGVAVVTNDDHVLDRINLIHQALKNAQRNDIPYENRITLLIQVIHAFDILKQKAEVSKLLDQVIRQVADSKDTDFEKVMIAAVIATHRDVSKALVICRSITEPIIRIMAIRGVASVSVEKMSLDAAVSIAKQFQSEEAKVYWFLGIVEGCLASKSQKDIQ